MSTNAIGCPSNRPTSPSGSVRKLRPGYGFRSFVVVGLAEVPPCRLPTTSEGFLPFFGSRIHPLRRGTWLGIWLRFGCAHKVHPRR